MRESKSLNTLGYFSRMKKSAAQLSVRKIHNHTCHLPLEDDEVNNRIYTGVLVSFRRRLWKFVTVSGANPDSKRVLKSTAQIYIEELRHFDNYSFIVHPFSQARFYWEMFMIPIFLLIFVVIPIDIALPQTSHGIMSFKLFLDVVSHVDIILYFFTGYFDERKQLIVMRFRKVVKHYLFTYFIFDLASSQPMNLYLDRHEGIYQPWKVISLLKMVRLPTLCNYLTKLSEVTNCCTSNIKFITFTIWLCVLMAWTSSVVYMVIKMLHPEPLLRRAVGDIPMLMTSFRVVRTFMNVGITETVNASRFVMLLEIACITFGSVLEIIILAKTMQVFQKRSSSRNKYNNLLEEIGEYMKYKELPNRLKDKIFRYVDFKFQKHIFREEDVLNNLSSVLKQDILLQRCQRMVEKVDFFRDLPTSVMLRIVTKLRSEIFLPSDVIVLAGYAGHAMYFIYMGTVAVYTGNGKEICHLEDGSHFGEIALVINEPRVATVIAVKECELFKLSRRDFQEAIEPFPELNKKIRRLAMARLENTLQMMSDNKESMQTMPEVKDEKKVRIESDAEDDEDEY